MGSRPPRRRQNLLIAGIPVIAAYSGCCRAGAPRHRKLTFAADPLRTGRAGPYPGTGWTIDPAAEHGRRLTGGGLFAGGARCGNHRTPAPPPVIGKAKGNANNGKNGHGGKNQHGDD
jgi:hypothetical protein